MKSKLLQPMKSKFPDKKSYGLDQTRKVVDGQESIECSSLPRRERENPPGRVSPATGAQARKYYPRT
jgi:hypothetical protein